MIEQLKKISMKHVMLRLLGCIFIILVLLGVSSDSLLKLMKGPTDFSTLSIENLPNSYIKGDINAIIDVFAEYYTKKDDGPEEVTDNYYIIPFGEKEYLGLKVNKSDFDLANQICDETYEYISGTSDELTTNMEVTGTISKMNDETYGYYMDWFETSGFLEDSTAAELESVAIPYILKVDYIGNLDSFWVYIIIICIIIVFLYAIIILLKGLTGFYQSHIKKYIKQNDSHFNLERLEVDYLSAVPIESARVGKIWTFFFNGSKSQIIKNEDIIWAYLQEVTHRVYGIKANVSKSLTIYTKDKKKYMVPMKKSVNANAFLATLSQMQPHIVMGYSDDLKKCFKKDFETFIKIPYMNEATDQSVDNNSY